ncbi:MAG TPA: murein L,D-transpeptidase family protein, partial [Beijerinckiaceae bacterium]|nr:murein L,D-transpeptidase family protein [Beijerinckiaceae bacterium]
MALSHLLKAGAAALVLSFLVGCEEDARLSRNGRHYVPIPGHMISLMAEKGTTKHQPILIRAFKKESELEVWKQNLTGEYVHLKTYPMCRWSGQLGPKVREGDRQVPEGFYSITPAQMNPNSSFYLSFNVGYPNAYDRAHDRTGSLIMVHGACSSMGCFSMTDEQIAEIYAITREAFAGGQKAVQLQSFPFRFTPQNMAKFRADPNMPFWKTLKEGSDSFEVSKRETQVSVCERRYVFNRTAKDNARFEAAAACPPSETNDAVASAVAAKARNDETKVAELVQSGTRAVRRIYKDGDQHPSFKTVQMAKVSSDGQYLEPTKANVSRVAEVSRPDDLEHGPIEIAIEDLKGKASLPARQLAVSLPAKKDALTTGAVATAASATSAPQPKS